MKKAFKNCLSNFNLQRYNPGNGGEAEHYTWWGGAS
jgi:hypothetical protein